MAKPTEAVALLKMAIEGYGKKIHKDQKFFDEELKLKFESMQILAKRGKQYEQEVMERVAKIEAEYHPEFMEYLRELCKTLEIATLRWEGIFKAVKRFKVGLKNAQLAIREIWLTVQFTPLEEWKTSKISEWAAQVLNDERLTAYENSIIPNQPKFLEELNDVGKSLYITCRALYYMI